MIVTICGTQYECNSALRGDDYVHLLNEQGKIIAAFEGVSDFSQFSLSGGDWAPPTDEDFCNLAVIRPGGVVVPSKAQCFQVPSTFEQWSFTLEDGTVVNKIVAIKEVGGN